MERLALVAGGEESPRETSGDHHLGAVGYFGLGLVGGGAAGVVLLVMLPMLAAEPQQGPQVPPAIAALAPWVSGPEKATAAVAPRVAPQQVPPLDAFDVMIDRALRDSAPFGFRLVGTSNPAGMEVVLRDVPAAVLPSRGQQRGPSTWALAAADLQSLRLVLHEGAPDAFDVRIDVLAPSGAVAANSLARVRLIGTTGAERKETVPVETAPAEPQPPRKRVASVDTPLSTRTHAPPRNAAATSARERVARVAPPPAPAVAAQLEPPTAADGRHWPEGASGLGAVSRASDRQIWWKLPAPSWSPFEDTAAAR
jgi:hypothetical protein